jgi:(p)ppGpp synthase/HD superfamily hydrolase
MDQPIRTAMGTALRTLRLKDMDASLLNFAILRESADLGVDTASLTAALELAAYVHRDDARGNRKNLPVDSYVTHPFRLVLRLLRYGCRDGAVLCAAALHDTMEDHPGEVVTLLGGTPGGSLARPTGQDRAVDLLAATFGPDVSRIVAAVTNPPRPARESEDERHDAYRAHVAEVVADAQAFLVKFADFVDNAGSLRHMADGRRRARLAKKYVPLVPVFRSALDAHRASLSLGREGLARIDKHLAAIAARI